MITKERLEEFIQNKTVIYNIAKGQDGTRWLRTLDVNDITDIYDEEKFIYYVPDEYPEIANFSDLFETEEDAEFALRYQNIPRTDTLSLPTWEEIEKEYNKTKNKIKEFGTYPIIKFIGKNGNIYSLDIFVDNYNRKEIDISGFVNKPLTKANYLEACELCRKLFLGEVE